MKTDLVTIADWWRDFEKTPKCLLISVGIGFAFLVLYSAEVWK
jgi:hypothetical protein